MQVKLVVKVQLQLQKNQERIMAKVNEVATLVCYAFKTFILLFKDYVSRFDATCMGTFMLFS